MDDELKAIQADLDSVLDRLAKYLEKGDAPQFSAVDCHYESIEELITAVIGAYTMHSNRSLGNALGAVLSAIDSVERNRAVLAGRFRSERTASVLCALDAVTLAQRLNTPLRKKYMNALIDPIQRYQNQQDHYFGEKAGLPRFGRINSNHETKKQAAFLVYMFHRQDPKQYPIGPATWERVGKTVHLGPSSVRDAYYDSAWPAILSQERSQQAE